MKILVVAPQPFFSPRGTPFSVYYRTLVTSELGMEVDFLTYGEGEDVDIPKVRIVRIPRFKMLGNVKIGPSGLKMFLDIFIFFRMLSLLMKNNYKIVHAHEEAVFFASFLKPFFKYKLIYDMHSSLTQQLSNFKFTTSRVLIGVFEKLENWSLKSADAVITICPDLYNFVDKIIDNKEKHFLIENSLFDPVNLKNRNGVQAKDNQKPAAVPEEIKNNQLVVYAGTLEEYQGIDILINSFSYVLKENPGVMLYIIGGTKDQVEEFRKLAKLKGVDHRVVFTGRVPQHVAKLYTAAANVLVSPRSSGTNTPLKIYEQIASGIPLVATNIYSHTQVLTDEVAFLVEPEPEKMARGILEALKQNGTARHKADNARELYEQKYSKKIYKNKLKQLFESIS